VLRILRKINSNKKFSHSKEAEACINRIEKELMAYELELFAKDAKSGKMNKDYSFEYWHPAAWVCLEDGTRLMKGRVVPLPSQVRAANSEEKKEERKAEIERRELKREERELAKQKSIDEQNAKKKRDEALRAQREERRLALEEKKFKAALQKEKRQEEIRRKQEARQAQKERREAIKEYREQARFVMEQERMQHFRGQNRRYKMKDLHHLEERKKEWNGDGCTTIAKKWVVPEDQRKKAEEAIKFEEETVKARWGFPGPGPKRGRRPKEQPDPDSRKHQPRNRIEGSDNDSSFGCCL
jgi:hypothetical protein